jgi:V8-like Glu-specific endopeptidase
LSQVSAIGKEQKSWHPDENIVLVWRLWSDLYFVKSIFKHLLLGLWFACSFVHCGSKPQSAGSQSIFSDDEKEMSCSSLMTAKGIYGSDNRKDWVDVQEESLQLWAKATVALVPKSLGSTLTEILGQTLQDAFYVCKEEKFSQQPTFAFCSGFLVGKDTVVTAGHCIETVSDCQKTHFIFDYAIKDKEQNFPKILPQNIYNCKNIIRRESAGNRDYAIIQLDRSVEDRKALPIRRQGAAPVNTPLVLIGHPSGLPSKIARGGRVTGYSQFMVTNVDAFAGNSGSLVINEITGYAEGILVAGDGDYVASPQGCNTVKKCTESKCSGEMVFPLSQIAQWIPQPPSNEVLPTCK